MPHWSPIYSVNTVGIFLPRASHVALVVKNVPANLGDLRYRFCPWVGNIPCRRAWQPTLVFLPGEFPWTEDPGGLRSVGFLGWEDPLEEGVATHSGILAWTIPLDRGTLRATVRRVTKSWT